MIHDVSRRLSVRYAGEYRLKTHSVTEEMIRTGHVALTTKTVIQVSYLPVITCDRYTTSSDLIINPTAI